MSARRDALEALIQISEKGAYANLCLKDGLAGLAFGEKQWVSALVYTTLEQLELLDYYIDHYAKGRIQPRIRAVLRLGICQMLFMHTPVSAACNESVKLTKEIGKAALGAYVNGVLRTIGRAVERDELPDLPKDTVERLHVQYSYPAFLINEYIAQYGVEFTEEMLAYRQHGMTVRAQFPFTADGLEEYLLKKDIKYQRGRITGDAFHLEKGMELQNDALFREGKYTVQSESAMLVCRILDQRSGRILDACSAPGGKSAYLSSLSQGNAEILAWELHPHRLELIKKTLERLHAGNVRAECRDATVFDADLEGCMDAVLLDVPCSGLGLPDKPDVRYRKTDDAIRSLCEVQCSILECCSRYVRPGGTLVYATCTISRRENEDQILTFLNKHPEFKRVTLTHYLPETFGRLGDDGMLQLFPHLHATEGFFIAKMEKCL